MPDKTRQANRIYLTIILLFLFIPFLTLTAQNDFTAKLQSFQQSRNDINQTAMIVLGSWAVGNILLGTYGNFSAKGETKYFHQFNALWNTVNLGIAVFGYLNAVNSEPEAMTNLEIIKDYNSLQSFLLLNAGLDLAYIAVGAYLKERAKSAANYERLRGYGNSLFLQGGFLLFFDTALYFIHQHNASVNFYPHMESLLSGGIGIGMSINL